MTMIKQMSKITKYKVRSNEVQVFTDLYKSITGFATSL